MSPAIKAFVAHFVVKLQELVDLEATRVGGEIVLTAFKLHPNVKIARAAGAKPNPARRKGPIQICPHPGCKARSAPVFSMMCKAHRNDPKRLIAKWRAARKAKKAKG